MKNRHLLAFPVASIIAAASLLSFSSPTPTVPAASPHVAAKVSDVSKRTHSITLAEKASEYAAAPSATIKLTATNLSSGFSAAQTLQFLPSQNATLSGSVTGNTTARTVQLQQLTGATWAVVQSQTVSNAAAVTFTILPSAGSGTFRVNVPAVGNLAAVTGGSKVIKFAPGVLTPKISIVDSVLTDMPTNQGFAAYYTIPALSSDANDNAGITQVLEKLDPITQAWVPVETDSLINPSPARMFVLETPRENRSSGTVTYRIHVETNGGDYVDGYSPTYNVSYAAVTTLLTKSTLVNGKTLTEPGSNDFPVQGYVNGTDPRPVLLQRYNAATKNWDTVQSKTQNSYGYYFFNLGTSDAATNTWRVDAPATDYYTEATTGSTIIKRTLSSVAVSMEGGTVYNAPWVNTTLVWDVVADKGTAVSVQQLHGKSTWVTMKRTTVSSDETVNYVVPHGSTRSGNANIHFRLTVAKSGTGWAATTSGSSSLIWSNPLKYTGYAKTVYNYMKAYCPTTPLVIQNSLMRGGEVWGLTHIGQNYVTVYGKIPAKYLQTVSLHECGHVRQWHFYNSDWQGFVNQMNKVYGQSGTLGMEQDADCIANTWHKNSYFGYKGNCVGGKGTVAAELAKGQKYTW